MIQKANLMTQIVGFFEILTTEYVLRPIHVSLYLALLREWNMGYRKQAYFEIDQKKMMHISKIGNTRTYTDALKHLCKQQLIKYTPGTKLKRAKIWVNLLYPNKQMGNFKITSDIESGPQMHPDKGINASEAKAILLPLLKEEIKKEKEDSINDGQKKKMIEKKEPGGDTELNSIKSSTLQLPKSIEFIQAIYMKFIAGEDIADLISPNILHTIGLKIKSADIEKAKARRINDLRMSTEESDIHLYNCYITNDINKIELDFSKVAKIAQNLVVIEYFKTMQADLGNI